MKTRHCDECSNFKNTLDHEGSDFLTWCSVGHRPRFYNPRSYNDENFGWKRKCGDFKAKKGEK